MEENSQKRRRTSPRNASSGADGSSGATESSTAARPGAGQPSYNLPTRPLPARRNSQSFEEGRSVSFPESTSVRDPGRLIPASVSPDDVDGDGNHSNSTSNNNAAIEAAATNTDTDRKADEPGEGIRQHTQQNTDRPSSSPSVRRGQGLTVTPKQSPAKTAPRPLPPPAPEGDDELSSVRLVLGRNAIRSSKTGLLLSHPEPDLPPSVPDIVSSTPPRGIHSSPSRWRERGRSKKSSPLKPKMSRLGEGLQSKVGIHDDASPGSSHDSRSSILLDASANPARRIPAHDEDADKKKERDALRDEIARLKRDLQLVSRENEHIRLMQSSGRIISSQDEDAVLDVLQRHLIDFDDPPPPPVSHQLVKAALNPMGLGLLPFSRLAPFVVAAAEDEEDVSDIKSHHPVPMTAEEELPYLQLFSPFTVASTLSVLPQLPNQPLRQRRLMTFRSKDALRLFTARVEMIVNAVNLNILELNVLALEPAARAELAPFLDKVCHGDCNRSMQRNVGILSWAMGEWYRVSIQRARLWTQLEKETTDKDGLWQAARDMRKRRKRRRNDDDDDDIDGEAGSEIANARVVTSKPASLLRFMGQHFFDVTIPAREATDAASSLRLEWKIGFDWVGEAQSKVAVLVGVPGKWRSADQRGSLGKLPKLFQELVDGGEEPSVAVRTIAALLTGHEGS